MAHFNKKKFPASSFIIGLLNVFIWIIIAIFAIAVVGVGAVGSMFGGGLGVLPTLLILILVFGLYLLPFLLMKEMIRAALATEKNTADTADLLRQHLGISEQTPPAAAPAPDPPAPKE